MSEKRIAATTGADAVSEVMRQINPDVVVAYPITPQTAIVENFSKFVADGLVDAEFVTVESEHSSMSACIGAAAAGARVMTATSSQGLALMHEMLYIASGMRLPIVMPNVNRTLSAPINIHCDHSDSMGERDSGWIQLYSENAQEAYDNTIQAIRIAENDDVKLPVMVNQDGFIISHGIERAEFLADDAVKKFVGTRNAFLPLLDVDNPVTYGPFDGLGGFYMEHKKNQEDAIRRAKDVILEVAKDYAKISGRNYGLFETYKLEDAEVAIVTMNSSAGTTRNVVDKMRAEGQKVGLLKPRVFRPFPAEELAEALKHLKAVAVLDRALSFGFVGPLFSEIKTCLFDIDNAPKVINFIYGLGGREFTPGEAKAAIEAAIKVAKGGSLGEKFGYLGLKETEAVK
ncbi:MAG: pyruvate ferredoxin oxidoreductase [Actinomycetota bacterium]|nr:pyruvate ferredoxin oxidoreductase [Actinomycetota bacterium]